MCLLHTKGKEKTVKLTHLLGAVTSEMTAKHKEQFQQHFHQPLLNPLHLCLESCGKRVEGKVVVSEEDLTRCLEDMHRVKIHFVFTVGFIVYCLSGSPGSNVMQETVVLFVFFLFLLYIIVCFGIFISCRMQHNS